LKSRSGASAFCGSGTALQQLAAKTTVWRSDAVSVQQRAFAMLEKLEFMIALSREQHFGRAAESCGVAQPTLSLGIQSLEQMLNVPLVRRSSRFQGFTPEGERVLVWARRLVGDAHAMRKDILNLNTGVDSHLRIAAIPSAMPLVAKLTMPFQVRHPAVRFTVLGRSSNALLNLLHQREIDIGVTYLSNEPIGEVNSVPLYREEYLLLTTPEGPLGYADRVTWAQAGEVPLCLLGRDLQNRRIIDSVLRRAGSEPTPMLETDSMLALIAYVRLGRWASIVPNSAMESVDVGDVLRAIPIVEPEVTHTIGLVVSERFPIQPTVAALMEEARALSPRGLLPAA
jgi:DNA-binding transcriptional LysR family regulator